MNDEDRKLPFLHRWATPLQVVLTIGLYAQLAALGGLAAAPSLYGVWWLFDATADWSRPARVLALSCGAFAGYFVYAICVLFVVGAFRFVTRAGTPLGRYKYFSMKGFQWASYNALILLVRYTCINFLRVTPFINLFHAMMGMKLGKRVQINTAVIGDSNLIEIGDDTVIGGDVTLVAHVAERGELVTAPVRIGKRVTIGLMAVIMPGVEIGDGAVIGANAILKKGTKIAAGELWAGVPAEKRGDKKKSPEST